MSVVYRTSQLAKIASVHPNTVRIYEKSNFISAVPREKNGYRRYSEKHLDQLLFARKALPGPYPGGSRAVYMMVLHYAKDEFSKAYEMANLYRKNVIEADNKAHEASRVLDLWSIGKWPEKKEEAVSRKAASRMLNISIDSLRNWERNNLLRVEKSKNGSCIYKPEDIGRIKIIAMLRNANFAIYSILQTLNHFDEGLVKGLSDYLKNIKPGEDLFCITNQWLVALEEHKEKSKELIKILKEKI